MLKKISVVIIVAAILVAGYVSLKKLNYWEKSVLIFKLNAPGQTFEGRGGRGTGEFEAREGFERRPQFGEVTKRGERRNIPDSIRKNFEAGGEQSNRRFRSGPDSLRQGGLQHPENTSGRGSFNGRMRDMDGPGERDSRGRNSINLNNVLCFLAVFTFFTVVVICLEKAISLIAVRRRNS